ncbi:hypothetical protein ACLKA6_010657 [Drosophila palustris]
MAQARRIQESNSDSDSISKASRNVGWKMMPLLLKCRNKQISERPNDLAATSGYSLGYVCGTDITRKRVATLNSDIDICHTPVGAEACQAFRSTRVDSVGLTAF